MTVYNVKKVARANIIATCGFFFIIALFSMIMVCVLFFSDMKFIFIPIIFLLIGIGGIVTSYLSGEKYRLVMKKRIPGKGENPSSTNIETSGGESIFSLSYTYEDEFGTTSMCRTDLNSYYYPFFKENNEFPVFVGGKYSFPDLVKIQELMEEKSKKDNLNKSIKFKICTYCGGKVRDDLRKCPNCSGNQFEDIG